MPPTNCGVTKSPKARIKTKIPPTTKPGNPIGKITYLKAYHENLIKELPFNSTINVLVFADLTGSTLRLNSVHLVAKPMLFHNSRRIVSTYFVSLPTN